MVGFELDVPATITALVGLVTALTALYSVIHNGQALKAVDKAVNNREGGTTVSQDVAAMAARFPAQDKAAQVVLDAATDAAESASPDDGVALAVPDEKPEPEGG